jgi:biotin-(acetyl-CoA carboxylase) ligase
MQMPDPTFPPLLSGHAVKGKAAAFATACERAARGELGAGDVVWSRNAARVEAAIILEPEVGLETAAQMLPLCMVALGDCLGSLCPPQVAVTFLWPDVICLNGATAGKLRAAAAPAGEDGVPPWMVIGLELRHQREAGDPEPGETPGVTWLSEEGGGELTRTQIIESYCRHFLAWVNIWSDDGFKPVYDSWLYRAENAEGEVELTHAGERVSGTFLGLDEGGNLLVKDGEGRTRALYLAEVFEPAGTGVS